MSTATDFNSPNASPPALAEQGVGEVRPLPPGIRVMCVDDNEDAADSLGTMLYMVGCEVLVAHGGAEALAGVEAFGPQVCLLDITMPEMTGYELARRLRELPDGDQLLLVALTALGDYNSLEQMADSGFDMHFAKPVAPRELYTALSDFAERGEGRVS